MRTTLNIPDELIRELEKLSQGKSKTLIITEALKDYVMKRRREKLLALKGRITIDYDWKAEEEKELLALKEESKKYGSRRPR